MREQRFLLQEQGLFLLFPWVDGKERQLDQRESHTDRVGHVEERVT
jgi:hypothetical protein